MNRMHHSALSRPSLVDSLDALLATLRGAWTADTGSQVNALRGLVHEFHLELDFAWPRWVFSGEGAGLLRGGAPLETASFEDLVRVLNVHLAVDRVDRGHLEGELRSGRLVELLGCLRRRAVETQRAGAKQRKVTESGVQWRSPLGSGR